MRFTDQPLEPFGTVLLDISVPSQLGYKTALVYRVIHELQKAGYLPVYGYHLAEVSLEEVLSNAMIHGNKLDPDRKVHLTACVDGKRFGVIVRDEGGGFSPQDVPDPNDPASQLLEHGRGIMLMDHYMDSVEYTAGGTVVKLVREKQTEPDPGATPPSTVIVEDESEREPQPVDSSLSIMPVEVDIKAPKPVSVPDELELDAAEPGVDVDEAELVEVLDRGGVTVARIHAPRLTEDNVHDVRYALNEAARQAQCFVIEMSEVEFMSSVGIGTIMAVYKTVTQHKGKLAIAGLTPGVVSVLKATGMLRVLDVHDDEQAATQKLSGK